jgi:transposase
MTANLSKLLDTEKDALILTLSARLDAALKLIAELQAWIEELTRPGKTPDNSSLPPSKGQKPNQADKPQRQGPRCGSVGRKGGGRGLTATPDETVIARPARCQYCQSALAQADQKLDTRYDKIDLPKVQPVVTRIERYAGDCQCCGRTTLTAVPDGLEPGTPFSLGIVALAMYLCFVHAVSYRRLSRMMLDLYGLCISEGALDAAFRRGKPRFDADVASILARLRRARVICSDETSVRVCGRTQWNWAELAKVPPMRSIGGMQAEGFQNDDVVIHVIRASRGAGVVAEVLDGHRPVLWVSDLYSAQQGHAEGWQICLAHQLRDCQYAIDAGDSVFAPRMKALLLRAVVLARRHRDLAESTRRTYRRRLGHDLNRVMVLAPTQRDGRRLRKRYGKVREHLFTFLSHPEITADNNSSERELRPTATYRKVTGGFRSDWGADLFAAIRSVIGTAKRRGIDAYQAIRNTLYGQSALEAG